MFRNIWRYSHLVVAVSSSVFLLLATITGMILAFESVEIQVNYAPNKDLDEVSLAEILPQLQANYEEVFDLKRTNDDLIIVSLLDMEKDLDGEYIVDLSTGEVLQEVPQQSPFYEFVTSLHRSLFLKTTGRWLVGINALCLFFMAISGLMLVARRQTSWQKIFRKVIRLDFASYSHTVLGRWMLLPLTVVSLSAVVLFLIRFDYLPTQENILEERVPTSKVEAIDVASIPDFKETTLAQLNSLEFPFSEFEDDYFILKSTGQEKHIQQYTGQVMQSRDLGYQAVLQEFSFFLHTGKGGVVWSIILGLSGFGILYFMWSGYKIAAHRFKKKTKNTMTAENAEIIVLYGSETGNTEHFAQLFFTQLLAQNYPAYLTDLNNFQDFPQAKKLVIFTATYGDGEAPFNAADFFEKFESYKTSKEIEFSVVGFGSTMYPDFCKFAVDVEQRLLQKENFTQKLITYLIDDQSVRKFRAWWVQWSKVNQMHLPVPEKILKDRPSLHEFEMITKNTVEDGFSTTFTVELSPVDKDLKFVSGDLLAVFPPEEPVERFYSIGKLSNGNILLAVKLHHQGLCSNFINGFREGERIEAYIKINRAFHLKPTDKQVTFIANGTGIAPFLGMIAEKIPAQKQVILGMRNQKSLTLYENYLKDLNWKDVKVIYSREQQEISYIQDWVRGREKEFFDRLQSGGAVMICGSYHMQKDVFEILDTYAEAHQVPTTKEWVNKGQIRIDTY